MLSRMTCLMIAVLTAIGLQCGLGYGQSRLGIVESLSLPDDEALPGWRTGDEVTTPSSEQAAVASALVSLIARRNSGLITADDDLSLVAHHADWVLERLLHVDLAPAYLGVPATDTSAIGAEAAECVRVFRKAMDDLSAEHQRIINATGSPSIGPNLNDVSVARVRRTLSVERLAESIEEWGDSLLYQRPAVFEELLFLLTDRSVTPLRNYEWVEGEDDLRIVAGRAAIVLEAFLGIDLPTVDSGMTDSERRRLLSRAANVVSAYREGLLARAPELTPARSVQELKDAYLGHIITGIREGAAIQSAGAMFRLLREWCPLGKSIKDLVTIVGTVGDEEGNTLVYNFDTGFNGDLFTFVVTDGRITDVIVESGE